MAVVVLPAGSRCLEDDVVLAFVEGRLADASWALVNQHIAGCDACRSLVAETAKFFADQAADSASLTVVTEVPRPIPTPPRRSGQVVEGQTIGRYFVERVLGAGGMGVVYLAHDVELHRNVALKLLRPDPQSDEHLDEARSRLLREAQAMARVSHPNVVAIHDVGRFEEQIFLAMEYVSRGTLLVYLRERARSWREVLELCLQAGRGLAAAHAANLVHRDFKPANVLIGEDGRVRVTDFGLAFLASAAPAMTTAASAGSQMLDVALTRTGVLLGTPAYASPEQLRGQSADPRSDQFSFCVTLYEALYRRPPFPHEDFAALVLAVNSEAPQPPPLGTDVPPALFEIVRRGLRADPAQRYARMEDLLDDLTAVLAATSIETVLPRRRFRRTAIAAVLASAAVALAVIAVRAAGSAPAPTARASLPVPSTSDRPPIAPAPPPAVPAAVVTPAPAAAPAPAPIAPRVVEPVVAPARAPASPVRAGPHAVTRSTRHHTPPTTGKARKPPSPAPAPPAPKLDGDALKPLHEDAP